MKYNKREIMTNAWKMFRNNVGFFGYCLKKAWINAKIIINKLAEIKEECHTWYGWKMLGFEVIHESKAVAKVEVEDPTTKKGTRILSYFTFSQVAPIEN